MTEQMPKLDIKTLEYVLDLVKTRSDKYKRGSAQYEECNAYDEAERWDTMCGAMDNLGYYLKQLIRKQQEVA